MIVKILSLKQEDDYTRVWACDETGKVNKWTSQNRVESHWLNKFAEVLVKENKIYAITSTKQTFILQTDKAVLSNIFMKILVPVQQDIEYKQLRDTVAMALSSDAFKIVPASLRYHCKWERLPGGNIVHTAMVVRSCQSLLKQPEYKDVMKDIVLTAAVWHDFGKTYSYDIRDDGFFERDRCDTLIGHIGASFREFWSAAMLCNVDHDIATLVGHCILASHGRKKWGSPIEPKTREAWVVHLADMLSSKVANSDLLFERVDNGGN